MTFQRKTANPLKVVLAVFFFLNVVRFSAEASSHPESPVKEWTVLVYMAADNDLESWTILDLEEMRRGFENNTTSVEKLNLLVQRDIQSREGLERFALQESSAPVEMLPEANSADPHTLKRFIEWGLSHYPARHYALILWGHGRGWKATQSSFGGLAEDLTSQDSMSVPELSAVLHGSAQHLLHRPWDLLITDACLLQTLEFNAEIILHTLSNGEAPVRFILGSTDIVSRAGVPYEQLIQLLTAQNSENDTPWEVARKLPALSARSFDPIDGKQTQHDPRAWESFSLSSVSSWEFSHHLLPALHALDLAMDSWIQADPLAALDLRQALSTIPTYFGGTRDIGGVLNALHFMLRKRDDGANVKTAVKHAQIALEQTLVAYALGAFYEGEGLKVLGFKGLASWLPIDEQEYLNGSTDHAWSRFQWGHWYGNLFAPRSEEVQSLAERIPQLSLLPSL